MAAASGSQIAWVTYYGSSTASTESAAIALQPGGSTVYVGGAVGDAGLPTGATFDPMPAPGAALYGFVGTFATGTGAFVAGTYVEGGQTVAGGSSAVLALAVNGAGAVTIAGYTTGNLFPTLSMPAPLIPSNDPSVQNPAVGKAVVLTLDQALVTELYGTYICGDTCLTLNTFPSGVAVDPLGNIYLSGNTLGDFPQAGMYVAANLTAVPPVTGMRPSMNVPPVGKTGSDAFAVQIVPATQTIGYSFWSGGTGNDTATGLALNPNESDLYVFGTTSSTDLVTNGTTTSGSTKSGTTATPLDANYPAAATTSGFVTHMDGTGQLVATTYLGGSSTGTAATATSLSAATVDGSGNVYVAGATSAPKAGFPLATSGAAVSGEPLLPPLQDVSADSPAGAPTSRGFLVALPSSLAGVTYLANLGPSAGTSSAVGVAVDGMATPGANAYVLLQSMDAAGGASFTTASAAQQTAQVANGSTGSAYLAQVGFDVPPASAAIAAGTNSSSPTTIYYQTAGTALPVTLTWNIMGASAMGAYGLVFNLPYSANLMPYTAVPTVTVGGNGVANVCTLGVSSVANTNPGITCVVPAALLQSATAQFVLNATLSPAATTTSPATFNVPAVAFDNEGDQLTLTQLVTTSPVPALTLTATVSTTTANAALSAADTTTPNTAVTYTYTISNTTGTDSPTTSLMTYLPATFQAVSVTTVPAGCNPTLTTCDVAPNSTLTYRVTGVFLGSMLSSTASGPFPQMVTAPPSVMFGPGAPFSPVYVASGPPSVSVQGNAQLSSSITASAGTYTYPSGAATGFSLGDTGSTLIAQVTNAGPNQAGPGSVTVSLPQGFVPTTFAGCTMSGGSLTCSYANLPGNGNVSFNILGTFKDTGTSTDAVAPPATSSAPTQATVAASPTSGTVTAQVSGVSAAAGTYAPPATYSPALSATVTRVNALSLSVGVAPIGTNVVTTYNETNVPHQNDQVTYVVTLTNSGRSVARGVLFTIPIATVTGGSVPSTVTVGTATPGYAMTNTSAANQLTCTTTTTLITCYENDLKSPPVAPSAIPAAQTYTVTFTATYNETTIPAATMSGQMPVTQGPGTFYAAAVTAAGVSYEAATGSTSTSTATITLQRSTHLVQTLTVSRVGAAPSTYADKMHINLDEHTGTVAGNNLNQPGVNDTVTITATTVNTGPNDAVAATAATSMVSIPVPPYMLVVSVPAYCSFGGVSGGTTGTAIMAGVPSGPNGTTMSCTPPLTTSAVPPGTVSQIGSNLNAAGVSVASMTTVGPTGTYPYTTPSAAYDGKNFVVTFNAKYVDAKPTSGTVPGANAMGTETFAAASASGADVDMGPGTSGVPPPMPVQRAAHVSLTAFPVPVYTNGTALPKDTVLVAGGQAEIAQAAPGMNAVTRSSAAGKVYNCIRYVLSVANTGPNYGDAMLNYTIDQGPFVPTQKALGTTGTSPLPADCAGYNPTSLVGFAKSAAQTVDMGELLYSSGTQSVNLDGFFDVGTLVVSNMVAATLKTTPFTAVDYNDSNMPATGNATSGDYAGKQTVTVVNTPFNSPSNDAMTPGFGLTPVGALPQVSLIFSTVTSPGITAYSVGSTAPASGLFPSGKSPNPPDLGATKALYQAGKNPTYYNVPTTAVAPITATNPTSICVSQATGLPDIFVKPERSLLWVIQNSTSATMYNFVPNVTSAAPLSGDITTAVASAGTAYTLTPTISFPQVPQAQPSIVCGQMYGFPTSAAYAPTLTVYEPVNFAPYVVAGTGGAAGGTVSKGSTVAQTQAYLLKSGTQTHDFNDSDPCYIGGARAKCDDNPYLYAFIFGGGNTGSSPEFTGPLLVSSLLADPALAQNAFDLGASFNLSGSAQVNIAVADQATGADAYNDNIRAPNYVVNPFTTQGGFLTGSSATGFPVCDPGLASGTYGLTPSGSVTKFCAGAIADPTTLSPNERYVPAGAGYQVGNVATSAVIGSASAGSGLISLPYPFDFTTSPPTNPPSATAPLPAIANVTPGQTAGFAWGWLNGSVAKTPTPAPTYLLSCFAVSSLTSITPISLPAGMTCNISTPDPNAVTSTTFTYTSTNYIPTILVVTTGNSFARNAEPERWRQGWGEALAALLLPALFLRRRLRKGSLRLVALLLSLSALPLLSGCGSGGNVGVSANVTPTGLYYFVVKATPTNPSLAAVTSAVFEVMVQKAN